jgi:23S rRNA pseudouridine1911/1915/1917 synthase
LGARQSFEIAAGDGEQRLDGILRERFNWSWSRARSLVQQGKVFVNGQVVTEVSHSLDAGDVVELRPSAPRPSRDGQLPLSRDDVVHLDADVIVVRKPSGISTVPFSEGDRGTLFQLLRQELARRSQNRSWRRGALPPLFVAHRLDRGTSGLLVFARNHRALVRLKDQFRHHTVDRHYLAIAHGHPRAGTIRSHLVTDRGDGRRGSSEKALPRRRGPKKQGKLAITHVEVVTEVERPALALVRCRLETGRTNQIRIHLSEAGHPLVGETLYVRGYEGKVLPAPRLMLHAAELGFVHPRTGEKLHFSQCPPPEMSDFWERFTGSAPRGCRS